MTECPNCHYPIPSRWPKCAWCDHVITPLAPPPRVPPGYFCLRDRLTAPPAPTAVRPAVVPRPRLPAAPRARLLDDTWLPVRPGMPRMGVRRVRRLRTRA